jgi:RHS repeat-associated protein
VLGEYGSSPQDVKAEFIWLNPQVGDGSGPFGGDDGLGGYMPLAVAIGTGTLGQTELAWVHASHMGVPIRYSDASGAEIATPTGYSVPGFPGQSRTLADLYYNRYRDYDPTTGRYIQADPIGLAGGAEPYGYAFNNPLRYTDPTGEVVQAAVAYCMTAWGAMVCTAVGGAAFNVVSEIGVQIGANLWNGRDILDPNCYDWNEVAIAGGMGAIGGGTGRIIGGGLRYGSRSLTRETGLEWSHFIPRAKVNRFAPDWAKKMLNQRGGLNGRWVTPKQHYRHDPFRYPAGWRQMDDRIDGAWRRRADRVPEWMSGAGGGAAAGVLIGEADGQ